MKEAVGLEGNDYTLATTVFTVGSVLSTFNCRDYLIGLR
jgi:hypothetical protein